MFPSRLKLCELFGIPLYVDITFLFLLALFVISDGNFITGILTALLLAVSVIAHEFGHSLTARAFGYETRDITISLIGGCASLISLPRKAYQEFLTALAGPLVSFALSGLGILAIWLLSATGSIGDVFLFVMSCVLGSFGISTNIGGEIGFASEASLNLANYAVYIAIMNACLGIFNLLPGFPLDGGRIFRSLMRVFMSRLKATYVAMIVGRVVAVGIALSGAWRLLHGRNWGFVTLLIAWMIWREGYREYQLACAESAWSYDDFRARVSPPPYGGKGDDCDVDRSR